jgi:hypothetical protein
VNALVFLGIAVGLSLVGCLVLWFRSRQPGSMEAHIRDFARELDALAPGSPLDRSRHRQQPKPPEGPEGPERPPERGTGPERPPERGTWPERPPQPGRGPRPG